MVLNAETGGAVDLGEELTMVGALNRALARAMQDDDTVVLLGEDSGVNGGVFRVTDGLLNEFGDRRVIDTPLAEITIAGAAVGMAVEGLKSVVEIQFSGFMYSVIDHIVNHAGVAGGYTVVATQGLWSSLGGNTGSRPGRFS